MHDTSAVNGNDGVLTVLSSFVRTDSSVQTWAGCPVRRRRPAPISTSRATTSMPGAVAADEFCATDTPAGEHGASVADVCPGVPVTEPVIEPVADEFVSVAAVVSVAGALLRVVDPLGDDGIGVGHGVPALLVAVPRAVDELFVIDVDSVADAEVVDEVVDEVVPVDGACVLGARVELADGALRADVRTAVGVVGVGVPMPRCGGAL